MCSSDLLLGAVRLAANDEQVRWIAWTVFGLLGLTAAMTAFYMFRLYFLTFGGRYRSAAPGPDDLPDGETDRTSAHGHDGYDPHPHESPSSMTVPLILLAAGSVLSGWLSVELLELVHFDVWGEWLGYLVGVGNALEHVE